MKLLCRLFIFLLLPSLHAQSPLEEGVIPGSFLVKLKAQNKVSWGEIPFVKKAELLSEDMNIWQLDVDPDQDEEFFKRKLYCIKGVEVVTRELRIKYRNKPNDTFFNLQNHLSIIHAQQAWDINTGGNTKHGDTIVVAVVDDGIDTTHPDLKDNFWYNRKEVPWDGIDNDSNGYIDDYRGWNVYNNNAVVSADGERAQHGTPVSGIIGARGNNSKGISGIMWKVKIMPVVGGDNREAEVIKAYSYVLKQRKLYTATNGKKGAYVVVVNSSWGADRKKPSDAPLWCAFYDTMGKYGILNVGATANDPINVEVEGDLPTTCPSNYLIGVTNSDQNDILADAGYGTTSIDLAAPGEETYTTGSKLAADPQYINFNGTSAASPIVAGIAGLLFSCACDSFLNLYTATPEQGLILIKSFILKGTDKTPYLKTKTASGGRASVNGAAMEMQQWCQKATSVKPVLFTDIKLFPNPVTDRLNVVLPDSYTNIIVQVFDLSGKVLLTQKPNLPTFQINTSSFSNGVYLIKIQSGGQSASGYFVTGR